MKGTAFRVIVASFLAAALVRVEVHGRVDPAASPHSPSFSEANVHLEFILGIVDHTEKLLTPSGSPKGRPAYSPLQVGRDVANAGESRSTVPIRPTVAFPRQPTLVGIVELRL